MTTTLIGRVESWADAALRSRAARYGGLLVGLGALAFLGRSLAQAGDDALGWFTGVTPLRVAVALGGFALYHVVSVLTLRPIFGGPALRIWGAGQLVKYLPVPGSAVLGVVGSTVRGGGTTRHGLAVTVRHSLLQVGGATVAGSVALGALAERAWSLPAAIPLVLGAAAGLVIAYLAVQSVGRRLAVALVALTALSWIVLGLALWYGVALGVGSALLVGGGFAAAWVVGQLALPVPAGLGVREAALLLLLGAPLGEVGALSFALGTRLVHVLSDAGVSLAMLLQARWRTRRE